MHYGTSYFYYFISVIGQWSNKDAMMEVHPPPSSHAPAASSAASARARAPSTHEPAGNKAPPAAIGNHRQPQQQSQWSADADEYDDTWTGSVSKVTMNIRRSMPVLKGTSECNVLASYFSSGIRRFENKQKRLMTVETSKKTATPNFSRRERPYRVSLAMEAQLTSFGFRVSLGSMGQARR